MPQAVAVPLREVIIERHQQGESLKGIAAGLGLSYWTVRTLWRRYRDRGAAGLKPDYERCRQGGPRSSRLVYRAACALKRRHPRWGAGVIRVVIQRKWPGEGVPHERTLQRWFRAAGVPPKRPRRGQGQNRTRGKEPHEVWEMDAKEHIALATGEEVSWLLISDEKSGAQLDATVFPPGGLDDSAGPGGTGRAAPKPGPLGTPSADPCG